MSTVQDLILARLTKVDDKLETLGEDMAVLKDKHNTGNKSEKIAAWSAVTAVVISVVSMSTACGILNGVIPNEDPIKYRLPDNDNRLPRKVQPKKDNVPDDRDNS